MDKEVEFGLLVHIIEMNIVVQVGLLAHSIEMNIVKLNLAC